MEVKPTNKDRQMEIIEHGIWVCEDCLMPMVYGDFSGLDYYYSGAECDEREAAVRAGMDRLSGAVMVDGEQEFSTSPCDCCTSTLHGKRHEFVRLGEVAA